jgi:A/G-specific adenine glycosylase
MEKYSGRFPRDYRLVRELPGLGPYTAAAVLSIAFDKPYPVFDANVRRVVMRLAGLKKEVNPGIDKILMEYISPYLPSNKMGEFNQAMMELGAIICRSKNPSCLLCPVTDYCMAYEQGNQEVIPLPKKKTYQKIEAVIGIIKNQDRYLIQKRPSKGLLADLWEFPGGKRKSGETLEQALDREIKEELGTEILTKKYITKVKHSYTYFQVTLHAYECTLKEYPAEKKGSREWVPLKNFDRYPFPSGSVRVIRFLKDR